MLKIHRLISTVLGIGYTPKGGGTVAAIATCIVWFCLGTGRNESFFIEIAVTGLIFAAGVYSSDKVEAAWGKDSSRVVIDEVAGMCLTLIAIPVNWQNVVTGLVLFRFFDIAKPLGVRKMEKLNGGLGVMMDDMLAGLYSNVILHLIVMVKLW